jgi:hypothetical protein
MTNEQITISVLNPRGEFDSPGIVSPSIRLSSLDGKRIGILKFGTGAGLAEQLLPCLVEALKKRIQNAAFRMWPSIMAPESRAERLKEIASNSDCVIVMLGFTGTSSARTARDAVDLEKLGKPVAFMVTRPFSANARFIARREGLADISLAVVPIDSLPLPEEIETLKLGEKAADDVIRALTLWVPNPQVEVELTGNTLDFTGDDYSIAQENIEKYFLQQGWSDGLPLVPPTAKAVKKMMEGTDLPANHLVGVVEPGGGRATIEKIAINAVMAGCLPQYMPVVIAAVEAITDPAFNLREVQCTSCNMAPLLIISGTHLAEDLNINYSFSTMGPGWKANTTIGRAVRLIMTNLGHTWPGKNDMKTLGSPFKTISLIAE